MNAEKFQLEIAVFHVLCVNLIVFIHPVVNIQKVPDLHVKLKHLGTDLILFPFFQKFLQLRRKPHKSHDKIADIRQELVSIAFSLHSQKPLIAAVQFF